MRIGSGGRLILMVIGSIVVIIALMMTFMEPPSDKLSPILGELALKDTQRVPANKKTSNYQSLKGQQQRTEKSNLRYKERKSEENPFFSLYKEQKSQPGKQKRLAPKKLQKTTGEKTVKKVEEAGFFNVSNSDLKKEQHFFEAVFREQQQVQDGKALRIFLKEAIPELHLEEGAILKGIPYLEGGSRLKIQITAAIVDDKIRSVALRSFDKEDCMEGLYHDDLAAQLEESTKNRLLEEAFDLEIGEEEKMIRRGKSIAHRFSDLGRSSKKGIVIERGRELFVAMPEQQEEGF